ncbi:hypothetical protein EMIT053CA3_40057 [Pseudomonas donghuensis]
MPAIKALRDALNPIPTGVSLTTYKPRAKRPP